MRRRRFLALGGTALLAGCVGRSSDDSEDQPDTSTPGGTQTTDEPGAGDTGGTGDSRPTLAEDLRTALGALPEAVDGQRLNTVTAIRPGTEGSGSLAGGQSGDQFGVPPEAVDRSVAALSREATQRSLVVLVGSFAAEDVDPDQTVALDARDGLAIAGRTADGEWEAGVEAASAAADDPDAGLADALGGVLAPVQDTPFAIASIAPEGAGPPAVDGEIEATAIGRQPVENRRQRTTYAVRFADADDASETAIEEVLRANEDLATDTEIEVQQYDRTVVASFVTDPPPAAQPDDSPDVRFFLDERDGEPTLVVRGSDSVDTANLEFRVDGEAETPPWGDRETPIEPGESFTIEVGALRSVVVWWLDPERENVEQPLGQNVTGEDAFETASRSGTFVLTYTGDRSVDADRLTVRARRLGGDGDELERPLTEFVGDRLESGDEVRLEDVEPGDGVTLMLSIDDGTSVTSRTVFGTQVSPPGAVAIDAGDGDVTLTYTGPEQPAGNYRVTVDDEPAATQFADEYDTLTEGDRVTVQADLGDAVVVEWTAGPDPVPVASETLTPEATFDAAYDPDDGAVTVTYRDGEPIDADRLLVDVFPRSVRANRDAWSEAYDTVEPGDSVTIAVDGDTTPEQAVVVFDESTLLARIDLSGTGESE